MYVNLGDSLAAIDDGRPADFSHVITELVDIDFRRFDCEHRAVTPVVLFRRIDKIGLDLTSEIGSFLQRNLYLTPERLFTFKRSECAINHHRKAESTRVDNLGFSQDWEKAGCSLD